jgi:hypothetical protein
MLDSNSLNPKRLPWIEDLINCLYDTEPYYELGKNGVKSGDLLQRGQRPTYL